MVTGATRTRVAVDVVGTRAVFTRVTAAFVDVNCKCLFVFMQELVYDYRYSQLCIKANQFRIQNSVDAIRDFAASQNCAFAMSESGLSPTVTSFFKPVFCTITGEVVTRHVTACSPPMLAGVPAAGAG